MIEACIPQFEMLHTGGCRSCPEGYREWFIARPDRTPLVFRQAHLEAQGGLETILPRLWSAHVRCGPLIVASVCKEGVFVFIQPGTTSEERQPFLDALAQYTESD